MLAAPFATHDHCLCWTTSTYAFGSVPKNSCQVDVKYQAAQDKPLGFTAATSSVAMTAIDDQR